MPKHFGLIGYPLSHSFSEAFFTAKFVNEQIDATYRGIELHSLDALAEVIQLYQLDGFNVTIPYKERIIPYLHQLDKTAKAVGAVNCVTVKGGLLCGYNTDIIGFQNSLSTFIPESKKLKALVFGSGGASLAVRYVLQELHMSYQLVSRNELQDAITYADLDKTLLADYQLLINTTPVGMFPQVNEKLPIPYHLITPSHYAFDLIYNPEKTAFLIACEAQGAQIKNGYEMLILQAEASYALFQQIEH